MRLRRHAKAPSAGSSSSGRGAPLAFLLACVLTLLFGVSSASATAPTATAGAASAVEATTATLNGEVDPADLDATSCRFDYVSDSDFNFAQGEYGEGFIFASQFPCDLSELTAGSGPKPVTAALTGLSPATAYHFRLIAENPDGPSESIAASTFTTKAAAPTISATSVTGLTPTAATLNATLNPGGAATAYRFEYVDAAIFEVSGFATATHLPVPDASAGSDTSEHAVSQKLAGLTLDTPYRYRVVATNAIGTTIGSAKSFRTFPAPADAPTGTFPGQGFLPDNRGWEVVTPSNKNGGNVFPMTERGQAAADGDAVKFSSFAAFGDATGTGVTVEYISSRDGTPGTRGWSTHAITPKLDSIGFGEVSQGVDDPRYLELSPDLGKGIFTAPPRSFLIPSPDTEKVPTLNLRTDLLDPGPGTFELLTPCPVCTTPLPAISGGQESPLLADSSADFTHVIFMSRLNLASGATGPETKLYEWDHGALRLASRVPPPGDVECDDAGPTFCQAAPSSVAGRGGLSTTARTYTDNTISRDGSRVLFTLPEPGVQQSDEYGGSAGNLYLRTDHATTVNINASERTPPAPPHPFNRPSAAAATPDLSRIFFLSPDALTNDTPNSSGNPKLYMYDATLPASDPHNLTLISTDSEPDDEPRYTLGALGASEDGDYVYFYSESQLIDNGGPGVLTDCFTDEFVCLYVWHDGVLHLVTRSKKFETAQILGAEPWSCAICAPKASRLTPDGTRLIFLSEGEPGEPYDHGSSCGGKAGSGVEDIESGLGYFPKKESPPCAELYLYDATAAAGAGSLTCVSCAPAGAHSSSPSEARIDIRPEGVVAPTPHLNRALSDNGRYVFFSTAERLVAKDTNGQYDAYSYDTLTGERHLLSSGRSSAPSFFYDASPDGSDAFFLTRERLSGWDRDTQADLYDARVGGGLPDPPPPPPSCQGDACQPPAPALNDPTPASSTVVGPGNAAKRKPRCRAKARASARKGRCAPHKKHHSQKRRNRAASNRGGAR